MTCSSSRAPSPTRVPPQITANGPTWQPSPSSTGRVVPSASAGTNTASGLITQPSPARSSPSRARRAASTASQGANDAPVS